MFDPYHKWLGIPPQEQPPNHYRLLALGLFEADPDVIDAAANRQMAYLQQMATGEQMALSQKLLNELSAARLCLLDPKKRAAYDAELRTKLGGPVGEAASSQSGSLEADPLGFLQPAQPNVEPQEVKTREKAEPQPTPVPSVAKPSSLAPSSQRFPKVLVASGAFAAIVVALILFIVFGRGNKSGKSDFLVEDKAVASGKAIGNVDRSSCAEKSAPTIEQHTTTDTPMSGANEQLAVIPDRGSVANDQGRGEQPTQPAPSPQTGDNRPSAVATTQTGNQSKNPDDAAHLVLPSGAILVLTFEEGTLRRKNGEVWIDDARGNGFAAKFGKFRNAAVVEGKVGKGLEFGQDKHGGYVKEDSFAWPRTMAAWLKQEPGGGSYQAVLFYGDHFGIVGGTVWKFDLGEIGISTRISPDDAWHHHCVTYDGAEMRYYFDGRVVAQRNKACEVIPGKFMIARNFVGVVDEVALFDRALSPDEVEQVYQLGVKGISLATHEQVHSEPKNEAATGEASGYSGLAEQKNKPKYPEDAVAFGGHHYKVIWEQRTWSEAEQECKRMGGHLACIETDAEKAFLAELKGHGKVVWLGAQRLEGDTWKWINGKPLDYRELKGHGHDPGYDYVGFHAGTGLNARPLDGHAPGMSVKDIEGFICEWD